MKEKEVQSVIAKFLEIPTNWLEARGRAVTEWQ